MVAGVAQYADAVRSRSFPGQEHSYSISDEELRGFHEQIR